MRVFRNNLIRFQLISWFFYALIISACQSSIERRPWFFQKPYRIERVGRIQSSSYHRGPTSYPYSILEIDGEEIALKDAHIRHVSICQECGKFGIEAAAFQVISRNVDLSGDWVLQIIGKEQRFFRLCHNTGPMQSWQNTDIFDAECQTTFSAQTGKCAPNECKSISSLIQ